MEIFLKGDRRDGRTLAIDNIKILTERFIMPCPGIADRMSGRSVTSVTWRSRGDRMNLQFIIIANERDIWHPHGNFCEGRSPLALIDYTIAAYILKTVNSAMSNPNHPRLSVGISLR